MPQLKALKYLLDIRIAVERIEAFMSDVPDVEAFQKDLKTRLAIERLFGIIGEAVNLYGKVEFVDELPDARRIVDFRNRLIHAYDDIDELVVWEILQTHIPALKKRVDELIR